MVAVKQLQPSHLDASPSHGMRLTPSSQVGCVRPSSSIAEVFCPSFSICRIKLDDPCLVWMVCQHTGAPLFAMSRQTASGCPQNV